jgi:homoserine trans-succinylase
MESFNLDSINPRFKLGATSTEFCDCIGLVVLYLSERGFLCHWENLIKREITKWEDFNQQMLDKGFFTDKEFQSRSRFEPDWFPDNKFIVWREEDGTGHVGIVHNNFIYQMTPYGIQISSEIPATKRPVYWYY